MLGLESKANEQNGNITEFKVRGSQKFQLVGTNGIINHTTT